MLKKYSIKLGYELYVCEALVLIKEIVSSSRIRHFISEGDIIKLMNY